MENMYLKHFENEWKIAGDNNKLNSFIVECEPEIRKILEKASDQDWSGATAPFYINSLANIIKKTLLFEPLSPLTFKEDEWGCNSLNSYQNKRMSSVFCRDLKGPYYDIDAFYHTYTHKCFMDSDKLEEINYNPGGWHGLIWFYDEDNDKWLCGSRGKIKNLTNFTGSNKQCAIPTIELIDESDTHNDFFAHITYLECIPSSFYKDYELLESDPYDFEEYTYLNTPEFKQKMKDWKFELLSNWKKRGL